ncbi:MAG: alkaline phosphatase family protein [Anaerolineaceae bacterium]|nr:alkaline phosphatase family protein [Anaerolineaceae bacterium]MDD4042322.1 alkaline phosphatase family protein [Anaerolineaceae bacterium]MDD4577741.1 alkaline phosphatase family protein [Anaerolineaceae bacterium]
MPLIEAEILRALEVRGELVMPSYDGFGLANLTPTAASWLGAGELPSPIFGQPILDQFKDRYQNVVIILADALGYNQLKHLMEEGRAPLWKQQTERGKLFPITSISPSTTATALTTIWTGTAPNQHGVIGYEMWYKDLGLVMNNILHTPITYRGDVGGLSRAGFEPTRFMSQVPLGQRFANHGVESHAFLPASIANSGLSQMHLPGSTLHAFSTESDMLLNMRDLLNQPSRRRRFIYAYWSDVDSLMHRYGTYNDRVTEQFFDFSNAFFRLLVNGLDASVRQNSLILLTADHGSVETPTNRHFDMANHPELTSMLTLPPTCEGRLPFLYVKQGRVEAVKAYFEHVWSGEYEFLTRKQVLDTKLLGNGQDHPDLLNRIGDLVAIPLKPGNYLWWPDRPNMMMGRHGGLHADEMLVPLFAVGM